MADARIVVEGLQVLAGTRTLVHGVSLELGAGQITALVGASGSGKTMTARAMLGLVVAKPGVVGGSVRFIQGGEVIDPYAQRGAAARERAFRHVRGPVVGYLPQQARSALNPMWSIGRQVAEVIRLRPPGPTAGDPHHWLRLAGFGRPEEVAGLFPHELSGGMAQRACIALALARGSRFLLADEPTTGLDPTVRMGILSQLRTLRQQGIGVLFITHDLRSVPLLADHLLVMHDGAIVDRCPAQELSRPGTLSVHGQRLLAATARVSGGLL